MDKPAGWHPSMQDLDKPVRARISHAAGGRPTTNRGLLPGSTIWSNITSQLGMQETLHHFEDGGRFCEGVGMRSAANDAVFRGTGPMVDMGEWMVGKLGRSRRQSEFLVRGLPPSGKPDGTDDVVQVFYLDPATTSVNAFRAYQAAPWIKYPEGLFIHVATRHHCTRDFGYAGRGAANHRVALEECPR